MAFLVVALAVLLPAEPHLFRFAVRHLVQCQAWRYGVNVHIRRVEGSVFEPVVLIDSRWSYLSRTGATTRLEVARTEAEFDWANLVRGGGDRCFQCLTIRGVNGKVLLTSAKRRAPAFDFAPWSGGPLPVPLPARIDARNINIVLQANDEYVRLEGGRFAASELHPGVVRAQRITIKQPWLNRAFVNVRGTTAMQDSRLAIANVALEPGVVIRSISAELSDLAAGQLDLELHMSAFGGTVRGQAQTHQGDDPFAFDASGAFTQVDIAKLVAFLGRSEPAGGTIDEGKFTFRGAPSDYSNATASLRLDATHFQWESRQWDSLALGATLMDQRVRVPEFELRQGANRLSLSGEIAVQPGRMKWWEREFRCDIAANIDNLTDLSALLLPEFKFAAGKATLDGSVRGQNKQFSGQLILTGSALRWRDAPIENLHAALKLTGNECRLTSIQFFNDSDYVRGRGVVNILGPTQYWGELRGSVDELGTYAALLQKPIVRAPLAGGAVIEWSGEGSARGHSGTFLARLNKVRTLGALAAQFHPINAELEGYYAPGIMHFNKFSLADDDATFSADVALGEKSLAVKNIRLMHGEQLWLEGDAVLPLDLWRAWPNTSLAAVLTDDTSSMVNLNAYDLDLAKASSLSGWKFPIAGIVRGTFMAEGPVTALKLGGKFSVNKGALTCGSPWESFAEIEAEVTAQDAQVIIANGSARHRFGDIRVNGSINLQNIRMPDLDLALQSERATMPLFCADDRQPETEVSVALRLNIRGAANAARVDGIARILEADLHGPLNLTGVWDGTPPGALPRILSIAAYPWKTWRFDVSCATEGVIALADDGGNLTAQLHLAGDGASPEFVGSLQLTGMPAIAADTPLDTELFAVTFRETLPANPTIDLAAHGRLFEQPFTAHATGPLSHLIRFIVPSPPLTSELVRAALSRGKPDAAPYMPRLSFRMTAPIADAVQLFEWAEIPAPPPAESGSVTSVVDGATARDGVLR